MGSNLFFFGNDFVVIILNVPSVPLPLLMNHAVGSPITVSVLAAAMSGLQLTALAAMAARPTHKLGGTRWLGLMYRYTYMYIYIYIRSRAQENCSFCIFWICCMSVVFYVFVSYYFQVVRSIKSVLNLYSPKQVVTI